jgi:hypothetical protein
LWLGKVVYVDTDILEEHTATFFRIKLNSLRMLPNCVCIVKRSMVSENQERGDEEE